VTRRPLTWATFSVRSSNSFEIAQRETKPTPRPVSTAGLIASVESRVITFLKDGFEPSLVNRPWIGKTWRVIRNLMMNFVCRTSSFLF
jgi:hypothetical protein